MPEPRPPWWLLAAAAVMVAMSKLLLTKLRTATVLSLLAGRGQPPRRRDLDPYMAARSVAAAGRLLRADCLPQAVALAALLQRAGTSPSVVLGCRFYGPSRWGAHAWVESGGERFDQLASEDHAELARLSAASRWQTRPRAGS